jgi:hypothetical protein
MNFAIYIRKIEAGLAFAMRILAPGPFGHFDRWLLLNQPWLWRTRIIPMLALAGWLAAGYYGFGRLTPISSKTMPTITDVSTVWSIMLLIGLIILGVWVVAQIRWPLSIMPIRQLIYTAFVYALIIFCFTIPPTAYSIPLSVRMAHTVSDETFTNEYSFNERYGFWVCTLSVKEEPAGDIRERLVQSLNRYGFSRIFAYEPDTLDISVGPAPCPLKDLVVGTPTLLFFLDNETHDSHSRLGGSSSLFGERLKAVRAAKLVVASGSGPLAGITTASVSPTLILSLVASMILLIFCPLSHFSFGAKAMGALWSRRWVSRPRKALTLRRLVSFRPSDHPTLYALSPIHIFSSHVALVTMFAALSLSGVLGDTPDRVLSFLTEGLTAFFAASFALLCPIVVAGCCVRIAQSRIDANTEILFAQIVLFLASTTAMVVGYALVRLTYGSGADTLALLAAMLMILGGFYVPCLYLGLKTLRGAAVMILLLGVAIGAVLCAALSGALVIGLMRLWPDAVESKAEMVIGIAYTTAAVLLMIGSRWIPAKYSPKVGYFIYTTNGSAMMLGLWSGALLLKIAFMSRVNPFDQAIVTEQVVDNAAVMILWFGAFWSLLALRRIGVATVRLSKRPQMH